jgi:hypothetical protein
MQQEIDGLLDGATQHVADERRRGGGAAGRERRRRAAGAPAPRRTAAVVRGGRHRRQSSRTWYGLSTSQGKVDEIDKLLNVL